MSVGANRSTTILHCESNIGGADAIIEFEKFLYGIILPFAGEATTATELCELEVIEFIAGEAENFIEKTLASGLNEVQVVILHTEINLINDFKKVNLKEGNREKGAAHFNAEFAFPFTFFILCICDKIAIDISAQRSPQTEELNIVGLDKTEGAKISQLFIGESECAEMVYLCIDFIAHRGRKFHVLVATFEEIFSIELGVLVEHYLSHCKFVKVGVKKRHNTR
jgi:hypothetical protein